MTSSKRPVRSPSAAALASIPPAVVNLIGDARVARFSLSRGGPALGTLERDFDPPVRIEEALVAASDFTGGLRAISMDLTSGAAIWLGSAFRFAFLEPADEVASRKASIAAEPAAPAPFVRTWR